MAMSRSLVASGITVALALGLVGCGACTPEPSLHCSYRGEDYEVGATWTAEDGCNKCVCGENVVIVCTDLTCGGDGGAGADGGGSDGGPAIDGGADGGVDAAIGDIGDVTNEVVPYPSGACVVLGIDGEPLADPPRPLDRVVFSAAELPPPTAGAAVTSVAWSVARAPGGSRAAVGSAGEMAPDVVGTYVVRASVEDDAGGRADHDCRLEVRPPDDLYVELTWDQPEIDVDIQLVKRDPDGRFCANVSGGGDGDLPLADALAEDCGTNQYACYYGNCKLESGDRPDWDGDATGVSAGDPALTVDDLYGYGPEAILLEAAGMGSYLAGVHFFSGHGITEVAQVSLRVFSRGQLRGEFVGDVPEGGWWEGALIGWPATDAGDLCVGDPSADDQPCSPMAPCSPLPACAQCVGNGDCGPGSVCDPVLELCVSGVPACLNDGMCDSPRVCIPATDHCAEPECTVVSGCSEARLECSPDLLGCYLPPAECEEENEPNNTPDEATPVVGSSYTDLLCRDDVDYLQIPVEIDRPLRVLVELAREGYGVLAALPVALLDGDGNLVMERSAWDQVGLSVDSAITDEYLVRLTGTATNADQWSYTLTVSQEELPPCDDGFEPNDSLEQAAPILAGESDAVMCSSEDIDYYAVELASGSQIAASLSHEVAFGDLDLALFDPGGMQIASSRSPWGFEQVAGSAAVTGTHYLEVAPFESPTLDRQPYTLDVVITFPEDAGVLDAGTEDRVAGDIVGPELPAADAGSEDRPLEDGPLEDLS